MHKILSDYAMSANKSTRTHSAPLAADDCELFRFHHDFFSFVSEEMLPLPRREDVVLLCVTPAAAIITESEKNEYRLSDLFRYIVGSPDREQ